jgi:hypothetical protein
VELRASARWNTPTITSEAPEYKAEDQHPSLWEFSIAGRVQALRSHVHRFKRDSLNGNTAAACLECVAGSPHRAHAKLWSRQLVLARSVHAHGKSSAAANVQLRDVSRRHYDFCLRIGDALKS